MILAVVAILLSVGGLVFTVRFSGQAEAAAMRTERAAERSEAAAQRAQAAFHELKEIARDLR